VDKNPEMTNALVVAVASYLEQEHIDKIRRVDPRLEVLYDPALLPAPRYIADHTGKPHARTPDQERRYLGMLARAEVMFDFDHAQTANLRAVAPKLKWLQATSAGIGQYVMKNGLDAIGVTFTTASGAHARPLADFCTMAMLMFAKDYFGMLRDQRARRWSRTCAEELTGKTLAIIGLGRVGREVARQAKCFDMRVIGTARTSSEAPHVDQIYRPTQLAEVLPQADFLVLIAPHTPETEGMIGAAELALMKPGAVIINIARGALIDEDALIAALREGRLAGAALDVFRDEPLPSASPLWDMPNVIVSPHSASTVRQENGRITDLFCENLRRYLEGRPLLNVLETDRMY
jgi:phosphoglycerate dehydrogenase-like enzyme